MLANINNSFSILEVEDFCIWMDPWIESANYGSWGALYKEAEFECFISDLNYPLPDLVYISHLHTDHYDASFLRFLKTQCELKVFFKDFKDGRLKKRIIDEVGPIDIFTADEYCWYDFGQAKLMIIPQISASSADGDNQVEYDLDTSIIIQTPDALIFNEVDNPLHIEDYINEVLPRSGFNNIRDKVRVGLIGYSGASDYPQSYLKIDREQERKNVINKTIKRFCAVTEILDLDYVIPAGGTFILDGSLNRLNQFAPVPRFEEIEEIFAQKACLINPETYFLKKQGKDIFPEKRRDRCRRLPNANVEKVFFNTKDFKIVDQERLTRLQIEIESQMPEKLKNLFKEMRTRIRFKLLESDPDYDKIMRGCQKVVQEITVFEQFCLEKSIELDIYLHWEMLQLMMTGKLIWNELTFHCVYERKPNEYEPDAMFSLNLYKKFTRS